MRNIEIPVPLQQRILLQSGLALLVMIVGLGSSWMCRDIGVAAPFIITAVLLFCGAAHLHWLAMRGRFIVLQGTIINVERTFWKRRPKALLLEVNGLALRVVLWNRLRRLSAGDVVQIYISDTTPLYTWLGLRQLASYLALTPIHGGNFSS